MTFGSRVATIRKEKKMSQSDLGKIAGISGDIVGKYERDEMKPSIETATKLAAALDVSLDYLVGNGTLQVFDKNLLRRIEDLSSLPDQDRKGILFALDGLLRDAKARLAYA
jgi:transcriptional regulator with XRE-family HTH domain